MSEKGGNKSKEYESVVDLKMILTAIVGVLLGAIIVLSLILTGVIVSERYRNYGIRHASEGKIADVVAVSYDAKEYDYSPAIDGVTASDDEEDEDFNSLLNILGAEQDDEYLLISSQTEYEKVVNLLASLGATITTEDLELPENFFYSGSLILTTAEMRGLTEFKVNSVTRDEYYSLRVDVSKNTNKELYGLGGKAIIIAVPNIQPEEVTIVRRAE